MSGPILLCGLDRRPGESGGRADVILLASPGHAARPTRVVSLPRDLLVDIPGRGLDRLNGAHHLGAIWHPEDPDAGVMLLRETLEATFGFAIAEHAVVDFEGFRRLVDALGGIEVTVRHTINDLTEGDFWRGARFAPGRQRLDGERALRYARTRRADGDAARRQRHLELLASIQRAIRRHPAPSGVLELVAGPHPAVHTSIDAGGVRALLQAGKALASRLETTVIAEPLARPVRDVSGRWGTEGDLEAIGAFLRRYLGARATARVW